VAFPQKISESPISETAGRIEKKSSGAKIVRTSSIFMQSLQFAGDPPLYGGVRNKILGVFVFVLFVTLWILNRGLVIQIAILSPFVGQF